MQLIAHCELENLEERSHYFYIYYFFRKLFFLIKSSLLREEYSHQFYCTTRYPYSAVIPKYASCISMIAAWIVVVRNVRLWSRRWARIGFHCYSLIVDRISRTCVRLWPRACQWLRVCIRSQRNKARLRAAEARVSLKDAPRGVHTPQRKDEKFVAQSLAFSLSPLARLSHSLSLSLFLSILSSIVLLVAVDSALSAFHVAGLINRSDVRIMFLLPLHFFFTSSNSSLYAVLPSSVYISLIQRSRSLIIDYSFMILFLSSKAEENLEQVFWRNCNCKLLANAKYDVLGKKRRRIMETW